ncbi:MAG TPA: prepilin-type N-terminal cleavage/methylation domain-containing protein [Verrucomicrobiae bacterium]|nr:prepilin-type N-terminal cleavage/methylation domain-containing protein [Verrucomicrobiae bacterium]
MPALNLNTALKARLQGQVRFSRRRRQHGFTLMEALVGLFILTLITGAIFAQLNQVQRVSSSEATKLDLTQQAREFADQIVRDIHMAGYPSATMYAPGLDNSSPLVAAGLVRVSPTEILLEGDVETSGTVYSVDIQYVAQDPNDQSCPCIRRSEVPKAAGDPLAQPPAPRYTEVNNVMPPGTGPGQSGEDLFTFFDKNGNPVPVSAGADISTPAGQNTISGIHTVKINLDLLSPTPDSVTGVPQRIALSVTGHLNQY